MKISLDKYTFTVILNEILRQKPGSLEFHTEAVTYYILVAWAERVRNKYLGIIPDEFTIKISIAEAHALMIMRPSEISDPWIIATLTEMHGSIQKFIMQYEQQNQPTQPLNRLAC